MNPSSVLSGSTGNSRMSLDAELRHHLTGCMSEILLTAPLVLGRPWPEKLKQVTPEKILKSSERNTEGVPSMLLDWKEKRPMELEVILGNPVRPHVPAPCSPPRASADPLPLAAPLKQIRIARAKGLEMPRLQSLYALLKMAQTRRGEDEQAAAGKEGKAKL